MSQIHAAASCRKQRSQPRPARPTYLRLWRSGDCAVHAFDTPDAFERCARRPVPMAGENTPPRQPRSDDKAERMIIVRGPRSKPGAVRAAKMAEMCEFGEHRPPPFPRPAVGRRANNDRLKPGRNSLVGDRAAISFMCCDHLIPRAAEPRSPKLLLPIVPSTLLRLPNDLQVQQ
jgi:hypothetical protein